MTQPQLQRRMDDFDNEDMAIPEIKLVQNVGGDEARAAGAEPGDIYLSLTSEIFKEGLDIIVVDMQKTRTYWGRTDISDEPPTCASLNADSELNMDGESCKECEHRCDTPWLVSATERRTKCLLNYNILAVKLDTQIPVLIRTSGISTKAVRELISQLRLNKALRNPEEKTLVDYHRAIVNVTSQKKKTASGDAYAFVFRAKSLIQGKEEANELLQLSTQLLGTPIALPEGRDIEEIAEQSFPSAEESQEKPPGSEGKAEEKAETLGEAVPQVAPQTTPVAEKTPVAPTPAADQKIIDTDF